MARKGNPPMQDRQRGVALIMVILVLLVLTVLGMTASMMMTQEDRISSRQDLQKGALYSAEAGLRQGEQVFMNVALPSKSIYDAFLQHTSSAKTPAAPNPIPTPPAPWDLNHLGTYLTAAPGAAIELANQEVPAPGGAIGRARAYYSLYVRATPENRDPTGAQTPLQGYSSRMRLVSVGFITDANGVDANGNANVLATKILEEEYNFQGVSAGDYNQYGGNVGTTNSGVYSPSTTLTGSGGGP